MLYSKGNNFHKSNNLQYSTSRTCFPGSDDKTVILTFTLTISKGNALVSHVVLIAKDTDNLALDGTQVKFLNHV